MAAESSGATCLRGAYELRASDIATGVDCRQLPYDDGAIDCVVLGPPYMEGLFRNARELAGGGTHAAFRQYYSNEGSQRAVGAEVARSRPRPLLQGRPGSLARPS
jgi:hypothetical protein